MVVYIKALIVILNQNYLTRITVTIDAHEDNRIYDLAQWKKDLANQPLVVDGSQETKHPSGPEIGKSHCTQTLHHRLQINSIIYTVCNPIIYDQI